MAPAVRRQAFGQQLLEHGQRRDALAQMRRNYTTEGAHTGVQCMNITLLACFNHRSFSLSFHRPGHYALVGLVCAVVIGGTTAAGYQFGYNQQQSEAERLWQTEIQAQEREIARMREDKRAEVAALSNRLADLRGRISQIDALGRNLVEATGLDLGELEFDGGGAAGGPLLSQDAESGESASGFGEIRRSTERIDGEISDRRRKFSVVEGFLLDRGLKTETTPAGWPIDSGWISSGYGYRTDPITGRDAFHSGTDFATHEGTDITAVAGGVVTFSGRRGAYGNLIEINHGNGYTTRYGHNKENLVRVGEVVRAGDAIGRVGNTGRSTGPHVHLEVREQGQPKDPAPFASAER